jgi:glycosyltransferase involved in cell wall biosynthesis
VKLVISNVSRAWGGLEVMAELLARGLQGRGHEVVLFGRRGAPLAQRLKHDVRFEPLPGGFDLNPRALWAAGRALRRHRPDTVLVNTAKDPRITGVVARAMGIPVIFRHENDQPYRDRPDHRLYYGWVPARHVVNSEATRRTILSSAGWIEPERVVVIPNGIDVARFARAQPLDLNLPPGAVAIGYIGRFEPRKGVRELASAWPRVAEAVPDAYLVIAGWGPLEDELRSSLGTMPRVRWLGFRTDVPEVMRSLDVLAVPSHWEGFGLVAAEALAAGVPVVATRTSSLPEIVADGMHGRLVAPHSSGELAEALIQLARDPALRRRMGEAGRERTQREFTLDRMLDRHEALLESLIRSHGERN